VKHSEQIILKRWIPILQEYERTKSKVTPRAFKFIKNVCEVHHISRKELYRYYRKWVEGGKSPESLLPQKRGARPGSRRTPKTIERNIIKAYVALVLTGMNLSFYSNPTIWTKTFARYYG
jgi:hypothetical protein